MRAEPDRTPVQAEQAVQGEQAVQAEQAVPTVRAEPGRPSAAAGRMRSRPPVSRRSLAFWAGIAAATLAACILASLALGAEPLAPSRVIGAILHPTHTDEAQTIVIALRLPRTMLGLAAGLALGLAGALMQGVTRNPLADPGLLGVNAGASLAVVAAGWLLGISTAAGLVWFAFGGAALAAVIVYAVAGRGAGGATPVKLTLAGAAVSAALISLVNLILLSDQKTYDTYRFWSVGALDGRGIGTVAAVAPFILIGVGLALAGGRMLDVLALGDDVARGLGQNLTLARTVCAVAVVLLAGSATAMAGPIVFVGLVAPHVARRLVGTSYRRIIALSALIGPIFLIAADVVGRLVAPPGELQAGIVVAVVGAPVMIAIVRSRRLVRL